MRTSIGIFVLSVCLFPCLLLAQIYKDPNAPVEDRVNDLLSRMTLDEKVGQMTQGERGSASPDDVKNYYLGSILNGGGSVPGNNTPAEWADMIDEYQSKAMETRLQIPFIYGTDAVHGHSNLKNATVFPHNIGLGAMRDPDLMEEIARVTALEVSASGVDWTFAPTLCVTRDERWGRSYECFGEDPEIAVTYANRIVKGLQGQTMSGDHIIGTAKHWIGDGGPVYGTGTHGYPIDRGDTPGSEINSLHKPPYVPAINEGVGSVMVSYNSVDGLKMHEYQQLISGVLKGELGFDGFVVSDWDGINEIPVSSYREQVKRGVNAGIDMMMVPTNWAQYISELKSLVQGGEVPISRIDDAVKRILRIKFQAGLFETPYANRTHLNDGTIGSAENRAVAREAVRKSIVLLKNSGNILPLAKTANIFVAGSHANNIGLQCGGWTIDWQGGSGDITAGTTILQGIQAAVTGNVTFNESGNGAAGHDIAIIVVGEDPYAEGQGDYPTKPLTLSSNQLSTIQNVRSAGVPLVIVLLSGRPLLIESELSNWDALIAAWLPGTEGEGVADVLFGDHAPSGKLSVSWPDSINQIPINKGDENYSPLFAYGFGLTYDLNPAPEVTITSPSPNTIFPDGSNIEIKATATDNRAVTAVHFYANGPNGLVDLGEDFDSPYSMTLYNAMRGNYQLYAIATDDEGKQGQSPYVSISVGDPQQTIPFEGTPYTVPGIIQAENFDKPGTQASYYDTTPGNTGGAYRTDVDVDMENASPTGFNVGWIDANEWLVYSIAVNESADYDLIFRLASQTAGGSFHLEMNGMDVTGSQTIGNTGGWQNWTTVTVSQVPLNAGQQTIRFVSETGGFNFDSVEIKKTQTGCVQTPYHGIPVDLPGTVQAEDYDTCGESIAYHDISAGNEGGAYRYDDVDIEASTPSGYNIGWTASGEWLEYTVNIIGSGPYNIDVRYASQSTGGYYHIDFNGVNATGSTAVGATGDWQSWAVNRHSGISLSPGIQVMRLTLDSAELNIDSITLSTGSSGRPANDTF